MTHPAPRHPPEADRRAVLTKAVLRAADRLGLTARLLSLVIGVSEASVSRMRHGHWSLAEGSKPFELAALLVRAFRSLDAILGGDDRAMRAWMATDNAALGGRPVDRIATVSGLTDVLAYLDARRAVV